MPRNEVVENNLTKLDYKIDIRREYIELKAKVFGLNSMHKEISEKKVAYDQEGDYKKEKDNVTLYLKEAELRIRKKIDSFSGRDEEEFSEIKREFEKLNEKIVLLIKNVSDAKNEGKNMPDSFLSPDLKPDEIIQSLKCERFVSLEIENLQRASENNELSFFSLTGYFFIISSNLQIYMETLQEELSKAPLLTNEKKEKEQEIELVKISGKIVANARRNLNKLREKNNKTESYSDLLTNFAKEWEEKLLTHKQKQMNILVKQGLFPYKMFEMNKKLMLIVAALKESKRPYVERSSEDKKEQVDLPKPILFDDIDRFRKEIIEYIDDLYKLKSEIPKEYIDYLEKMRQSIGSEEFSKSGDFDVIDGDNNSLKHDFEKAENKEKFLDNLEKNFSILLGNAFDSSDQCLDASLYELGLLKILENYFENFKAKKKSFEKSDSQQFEVFMDTEKFLEISSNTSYFVKLFRKESILTSKGKIKEEEKVIFKKMQKFFKKIDRSDRSEKSQNEKYKFLIGKIIQAETIFSGFISSNNLTGSVAPVSVEKNNDKKLPKRYLKKLSNTLNQENQVSTIPYANLSSKETATNTDSTTTTTTTLDVNATGNPIQDLAGNMEPKALNIEGQTAEEKMQTLIKEGLFPYIIAKIFIKSIVMKTKIKIVNDVTTDISTKEMSNKINSKKKLADNPKNYQANMRELSKLSEWRKYVSICTKFIEGSKNQMIEYVDSLVKLSESISSENEYVEILKKIHRSMESDKSNLNNQSFANLNHYSFAKERFMVSLNKIGVVKFFDNYFKYFREIRENEEKFPEFEGKENQKILDLGNFHNVSYFISVFGKLFKDKEKPILQGQSKEEKEIFEEMSNFFLKIEKNFLDSDIFLDEEKKQLEFLKKEIIEAETMFYQLIKSKGIDIPTTQFSAHELFPMKEFELGELDLKEPELDQQDLNRNLESESSTVIHSTTTTTSDMDAAGDLTQNLANNMEPTSLDIEGLTAEEKMQTLIKEGLFPYIIAEVFAKIDIIEKKLCIIKRVEDPSTPGRCVSGELSDDDLKRQTIPYSQSVKISEDELKIYVERLLKLKKIIPSEYINTLENIGQLVKNGKLELKEFKYEDGQKDTQNCLVASLNEIGVVKFFDNYFREFRKREIREKKFPEFGDYKDENFTYVVRKDNLIYLIFSFGNLLKNNKGSILKKKIEEYGEIFEEMSDFFLKMTSEIKSTTEGKTGAKFLEEKITEAENMFYQLIKSKGIDIPTTQFSAHELFPMKEFELGELELEKPELDQQDLSKKPESTPSIQSDLESRQPSVQPSKSSPKIENDNGKKDQSDKSSKSVKNSSLMENKPVKKSFLRRIVDHIGKYFPSLAEKLNYLLDLFSGKMEKGGNYVSKKAEQNLSKDEKIVKEVNNIKSPSVKLPDKGKS